MSSSGSSEENISILRAAFPDLSRDEISDLSSVQSSLLNNYRRDTKRKVSSTVSLENDYGATLQTQTEVLFCYS